MNTKLQLMYRDGDNYKNYLDVVIEGEITNDQIKVIENNLYDGEYLIANQVGLPTPSEGFSDKYNFPTESDHAWTTMVDFQGHEPSREDMLTDEEPTIHMTVDDFVKRIVEVTWDESNEMERLGIPAKYIV